MNQELEKKLKNDEQAEALFLEYKNKENKIKKMLKEYENAKERGATIQELAMLKKAIKNEQQPLLESFYKYKELENGVTSKKKEVRVEKVLKENKKPEKEQIIQLQKTKTGSIKTVTLTLKKADIIPIKKYIEPEKSSAMRKNVAKTRKMTRKRRKIRKTVVRNRRTLNSKVVPISRRAMIKRQRAKRRKKIRKRSAKKQQTKRYTTNKRRNQFIARRKSKSITHMLKKRMKAVRKFLGWKGSQNKEKEIIEPTRQQKRERQFKIFNLRVTVNNMDGHIEENANKKISKMPNKDKKEEKELHVIGW